MEDVKRQNSLAKKVIPEDDFKIVSMNMRDADTNKTLWQVEDWKLDFTERVVQFPAEVLKCKALSREIVFYSKN